MKKILISTTVFTAALTAAAQGNFKVGLQLTAYSSLLTKTKLYGYESNAYLSLNPALICEAKLVKKLVLRTGLGYQKSGANFKESSLSTSPTTTPNSYSRQLFSYRINSLTIPLELTVPWQVGKSKVLFMAGPSINYAINGSIKNDVRSELTLTEPVEILTNRGTTNLQFRRNHFPRIMTAAKFGMTFRAKSDFELNANYLIGLTKISNNFAPKTRNNSIGLGLTYFFKK